MEDCKVGVKPTFLLRVLFLYFPLNQELIHFGEEQLKKEKKGIESSEKERILIKRKAISCLYCVSNLENVKNVEKRINSLKRRDDRGTFEEPSRNLRRTLEGRPRDVPGTFQGRSRDV